MTVHVYEFEFFESGGSIDAVPCDELGEGTFGEDLEDAMESAADWLRCVIDMANAKGVELPHPVFGHKPAHGGKVIALAIVRELNDVPAMTAADAARELGVSTARIAQLCAAGLLVSWKDGSRRMVTKDSVEARKAEKPAAGRPRVPASV